MQFIYQHNRNNCLLVYRYDTRLYTVTHCSCLALAAFPVNLSIGGYFSFHCCINQPQNYTSKPKKIDQNLKYQAKITTKCITFSFGFEVTCVVNGSLKYIPQEYIHNHPLKWKHNSRPVTRFEINLAKLKAEEFVCRHQKSTRIFGLSPDCV